MSHCTCMFSSLRYFSIQSACTMREYISCCIMASRGPCTVTYWASDPQPEQNLLFPLPEHCFMDHVQSSPHFSFNLIQSQERLEFDPLLYCWWARRSQLSPIVVFFWRHDTTRV